MDLSLSVDIAIVKLIHFFAVLESDSDKQTRSGTETTATTSECYSKCEIITDCYQQHHGLVVHRLQSRLRYIGIFGEKTHLVTIDAAHERERHQAD